MSKLMSENCIVFDIDTEAKEEVLKTLVKELYAANRITDVNEFFEDVLAREAIAPTFVGFDMGLPHGKTDHVLEASVCFGRTAKPVIWNEESGDTADLIILIAVPLLEAGDTHMKILANLSRKLMHEEFRESLRTSTKEQVYAILTEVLEG
ncbi:MAG: fructose PTS transporter subunit IIA [Hungatella sp.]